MSSAPKSVIATPFHDHARLRRRRWYWLTPVLVLFLYACVMGVFFWLQRIHDDSVMFVTIDQEARQRRHIGSKGWRHRDRWQGNASHLL